jgi:hypothetical protein
MITERAEKKAANFTNTPVFHTLYEQACTNSVANKLEYFTEAQWCTCNVTLVISISESSTAPRFLLSDDDVFNEDWIIYRMVRSHRCVIIFS